MASKGLAFLAGAGEGLVEGEKLRRAADIEGRKLKIQEAGLALQEGEIKDRAAERQRSALQAQIKVIDDAFTGIVDAAPKLVEARGLTPETGAALQTMRNQAAAQYQYLEEKGIVPPGTAQARINQFDTRLRSALTPAEQGVAAANKKVAEEQAMEIAFGPEWNPPTVDKQGNLIQQSRKGQVNVLAQADKPGEFERLIAGLPPEQREKLKQQRLVKLVESSGFSVEFGEDGKVTSITQGPKSMSPARISEMQMELDSINDLSGDIDKIVAAQKSGTIQLGLAGTVQRGGREAVSILKDVSGMVPGLRGLNERASGIIDRALGGDRTELNKALAQDATLGELAPIELAIGVAMARDNQPTGRLLADVLKETINNSRLTGLRSEQQVTERLNYVQDRLNRRKERLQGQLGERPAAAPAAAPAATAPKAGAAPTKTMRAVRDPNAPGGFRLEAQKDQRSDVQGGEDADIQIGGAGGDDLTDRERKLMDAIMRGPKEKQNTPEAEQPFLDRIRTWVWQKTDGEAGTTSGGLLGALEQSENARVIGERKLAPGMTVSVYGKKYTISGIDQKKQTLTVETEDGRQYLVQPRFTK